MAKVEPTITKADVVSSILGRISANHATKPAHRQFSHALRGGVYELAAGQATTLRQDRRIKYVERDQRVSISATQTMAPWGLDRLDQAALPLDRSYQTPAAGAQVTAYIIDTGITAGHVDFGGRASFGYDFVDHDNDATDCNGHGTHVAGTIGGATYGVAKNVKLVGVRVLDCEGSGSNSDVIAGIEWVTANHVKPAVANMSLGGGVSQALDDAMKASIQAGVTFVVAAGNENADACLGSPSRVGPAITVGATTNRDARASFSNYGTCVDVFAPGQDILSAWFTDNRATNTISGTSMASPHVAGIAALYLSQHPTALPAEVSAKIVEGSLLGKVGSPGTGSPNRLVNTGFLLGAAPSPSPAPTPTPTPQPTPVPPPEEPGVITLQNGVPRTVTAGAKGSEIFFLIQVPTGAKNLSIGISGSSGDADLYTRKLVKPTSTIFDCRPYTGTSSETCTTAAPSSGKVYVRVYGYSAYSNLKVTAQYTKP